MSIIFIYKISYILTIIGSALAAILVLRPGFRSRANVVFGLTTINAVIWALGRYMLVFVDDYESARVWVHILYIGSILVHVFFFRFILEFVRDRQRTMGLVRKSLVRLIYINGLILLLANVSDLIFNTNYFIAGLVPLGGFKFYEVPNALYHLHLINYLLVPSWAFFEMLFAFKRFEGIKRQQLKFVFWASILGFVGGNTVVFWIYNIPIPPVGVWLVPFYLLAITYAMTRYRLLDIRTIIIRSLAFSSIVLILSALVSFLSVLIILLLGAESIIWTSIVPAMVVALAYHPLSNLIERLTNKILYKRSYNPDDLLANVTAATSSLLSLSELLSKIAQELTAAFQAGKIGVALINKSGGLEVALRQNFSEAEADKILQYPDTVAIMTRHFETLGPIIAVDELKIRFDNGEYAPTAPELLNLLYASDVALLVALKDKEKLLGAIALGNKKSGDLYTLRDMAVLKIIAGHISIAVNNALLYEEAQQFNVTLRREVERATAELEKANAHLRELDQSKSEFLSIAAHQLRTPLTGIKGYVSMFLEGDYGKLNAKQQEELEKIYRASDRLTRLIEVFLNVSRIETGRLELNKTPSNFEQIVSDVVGDLTPAYQKKGLQLSVQPPSSPLPPILMDHDKIQDVMMNLVDNAIKYSPAGSINIRLDRSPSLLTFQIKDSGIGIDPSDIGKLFQKFSRADVASHIQTGGSGLGLFVAKKIVEEHGGRIWAESEGKGQGATFTFTLPIVMNENEIRNSNIETRNKSK